MREVLLTALFKADLDSLDNSIRERVPKTLRQIEHDPYYPGLETHPHNQIQNRKIMRSRVNDNFRILWEWVAQGNIMLWRVGSHKMIDAINDIRATPREQTRFFARDEQTHTAVELEGLEVSRDLPQPFRHVPHNILRLLGVPDQQLQAVKSIADEEDVWDLPIPENVQMTLLDILTNPQWTLKDLLDTRQLLYRTTVDQLEGYCEGKIKQLLLNLNEEQESYVHIRASGPVLIKGVAGSGKTTIGLYRAHRIAQTIERSGRMFGEGATALLLTYSQTLTTALEQLYRELYGEDLPYTILVEAYKEWMLQQLQGTGRQLKPAGTSVRRRLVDEAKLEVARIFPGDRVVTRKYSQFLLDEFDKVIRARRIEDLAAYQAIDRVGRGSALDRERHRPIVWEIYQRYQRKLDKSDLYDWADLARLVQKHCQPLPQFDVVIVDEAQDLPPSDLHLATRLLPDYSSYRSLTLLADPAQSIYYRGIPWKEANINIQGRTRILAKNLRNTQQILEASRHIVEGCDDLKAEEEYIPPSSAHRRGPKPVTVQYRNWNDSMRFVVEEIIKLSQDGKYRLGDFAILSRNNQPLPLIQKHLRQEHINCAMFRADGFHIFENDVKLITMHSAKGLEFPVVFMIALSDDVIPFVHKYSETKAEDVLQERKLFYVSMTRSAERLYLLHPQRDRSSFLRDLDNTTVVSREC